MATRFRPVFPPPPFLPSLGFIPALVRQVGSGYLGSQTPGFPAHYASCLQVNVGAGSHPHKVKVYGPGVAKTGLKANEPTYFTVDCAEAGQGERWLAGGAGRKSGHLGSLRQEGLRAPRRGWGWV